MPKTYIDPDYKLKNKIAIINSRNDRQTDLQRFNADTPDEIIYLMEWDPAEHVAAWVPIRVATKEDIRQITLSRQAARIQGSMFALNNDIPLEDKNTPPMEKPCPPDCPSCPKCDYNGPSDAP